MIAGLTLYPPSEGAQYYTWDILCVIHTNSESFLRDVNMI